MHAEAKFCKINQVIPFKEPADRGEGGRRVDKIDGGLPMDNKCINFRVAGLVKQGGFV